MERDLFANFRGFGKDDNWYDMGRAGISKSLPVPLPVPSRVKKSYP